MGVVGDVRRCCARVARFYDFASLFRIQINGGQTPQRIIAVFNDLDQLRSKWHLLVINVAVTIIKWIVVSYVFWMAFRCFSTVVNWPHIGVIPILSTLVGYVPISIAGIGTVEVSAVFLFGKIGISKPVVISVYILLSVFSTH